MLKARLGMQRLKHFKKRKKKEQITEIKKMQLKNYKKKSEKSVGLSKIKTKINTN